MYISVLQRNKKTRKSLHFKRRVVSVYRAEIAQPADIQRYLHISLRELRQLNRWYYKHRLAPFLYPYRYFKRMKKNNQEAYIKALERRLSATEAELRIVSIRPRYKNLVLNTKCVRLSTISPHSIPTTLDTMYQ